MYKTFIAWLITAAMLATTPTPSKASQAAPAPKPGQTAKIPSDEMTAPTFCAGEDAVWDLPDDDDLVVKQGSNLTVMFHGNRFPASRELVNEFEKFHPDIKVSFSSLPPTSIAHKLDRGNSMNLNLQETHLKKASGLDYPDVVMLPAPMARSESYKDKISEPRLYSKISGIVVVARSDDPRIKSAEDIKKTDAKFVLAGNQSQKKHAIYTVPKASLGAGFIEHIKKLPSTGFSQTTHHRSVPARILLKCEDVGFQFKQSQPYLEKRLPNKFKFFDLPLTNKEGFVDENSYVAITTASTHKANAAKFTEFVLGPQGQEILKKYHVALE